MTITADPLDTGLSVEAIRRELRTSGIGQTLYVYGTIESTNTRLARLAQGGAPDGTALIADAQTAARRRGDTMWFSPPGANLCVSVLFRRRLTVKTTPVFAFIAALAVADAVEELGLHPVITEANDVLVDGKKVARVRGEYAGCGDVVDSVILGVGVNLNVTPVELLAALGTRGRFATSLGALTGEFIDRNAFAAAYLRALAEWTECYDARGPSAILAARRDRDG